LQARSAAYVLNYQSAAIYGFYATAEDAVKGAYKKYTVVLMKVADYSGKTLEAKAPISLRANGFSFTYAEFENITVQ